MKDKSKSKRGVKTLSRGKKIKSGGKGKFVAIRRGGKKRRGEHALKAARNFMNLATRVPMGEPIDIEEVLAAKADVSKSYVESKKLRRATFLSAYAAIYAIFSAPNQDDVFALIRSLAEGQGRKPDPVKVLLDHLVGYERRLPEQDPNLETDPARKCAQQEHSRDAKAVMYLLLKGFSPSEASQLIKQKGQGLDAWGKRYSSRKRKVVERPPEKTAETRVIRMSDLAQRVPEGSGKVVLVIIKESPAGNILGMHRLGLLGDRLKSPGCLVNELNALSRQLTPTTEGAR